MKKGVIFWLTFTLSLLAMTALTGTSSQSIKVLPGPVEVKQGNNVTLWCKLEGDPNKRPPVTWQSPPGFQTRTSDCISYIKKKYLISCAGSRWYNMTIVDVQWSDNGKYKCISNIYKIVDLQVLVPVTVVPLTRIPPSSKEELLLLGKDSKAELSCTTNCAYPVPSISWFENDQPINGSMEVTECTGVKKGLKLTKSTVTVTGKYEGEERKPSNISCTAGNIKGEPKDSRTVNIRYNVPVTYMFLTHIPRSKEKLLSLGKDSDVELTCTTNCAYPASNISWFKNDQPFNISEDVTITECTGEEKGQKRTRSMVTVTGENAGEKGKQYNISCTAENVKGEEKVTRMVNVRYNEIAKPQPVMAPGGTVAAIVVPVLVIIVLIIIIVVGVHMYREKKGKDVKRDEGEDVPLIQNPIKTELLKYVIYEYDDTSATHKEGIALLEALREGLSKHNFEVELREMNETGDRPISKVSEAKSKKVILHFPKDKFDDEDQKELAETFKAIMVHGGGRSFVAVIIKTEAFETLPSDLQRIEKQWNKTKRQTQGFGIAKYHLQFLQNETIEPGDVALMNLGTSLAWSYYLGYLMHILSIFKKTLLTSTWRDKNPDIPGSRIAKQIYIVFTTNCQKPKIMNSEQRKSERIKLKLKEKHPIDRAGLKRDYHLEIQQVNSKDGKESYYGVVCFLSAVQCLSEMRDDPNKGFFWYDEDDMRTHGQDCFEKLKLVIKHNEKIKADQSKFDFIEFNTEAENADENDLADELFNRMKEACSLETRNPIEEPRVTDANQTGVFFGLSSKDIKDFVNSLANSKMITDCPDFRGQIEFGFKLIKESKRIFMVLTDDFVKSDAFAKWFYMILDKGFQINDKRFLVCLNCLDKNANHPKVLELEQLFDYVCYDEGWTEKVRRELEGDVEEIRYEQLFHNIGAGLAMSWYYKFLKIKIPKVRDVIDQCPTLKDKFLEGRMSHKVFILFPSSCFCPEKVPCVDIIKEVDSKEIKLPHIKKDNRDYTPRVYKLDVDGEEYYAFFEYSTPAQTMYQLMNEGFLKLPEETIQEEWERFYTKLLKLITHKDEPMDIRSRIFFIRYKDTHLKAQALEFKLLTHVKEHIPTMTEWVLPRSIDNGATVEVT